MSSDFPEYSDQEHAAVPDPGPLPDDEPPPWLQAEPDHPGQGSALSQLRVPPHSDEAEQAVLGGLMLDNQAWERVEGLLVETDFYRYSHQLLFRGINELTDRNQPYDVITLAEWLEQHDWLETIGGTSYLGSLLEAVPTAVNIGAYAHIVRENAILRQLIEVGTEIAQSAFRPEGRNSDVLLEMAEQQVFAIADAGQKQRKGFQAIRDLMGEAVDRITELYERDEPITGLPSGFADFDEKTSGLQKGDLLIVAGRPSMGKTTFAMNLAENVALATSKAVAVFSMEMPGEQLALRMMSSLGRIDQQRVRTGRLEDQDWSRLTSAVSMLSNARIFIDDTPALSPTEVRSRARRLARDHDLGLIVLDYLQLMQVPGFKENRTAEISEISRSLKALAKELDVPVIALSQLNRSLEQRPNKRPVMSDLRESGAIEQDADVIVFIYRDEVYNPDSPQKGMAEIIIAKQRNGPIGTVNLTFLGRHTRFEDYAPESYAAGEFDS
ncbi:MAG: replicative DNA helicase [Halothiobacillaceae bacterium]